MTIRHGGVRASWPALLGGVVIAAVCAPAAGLASLPSHAFSSIPATVVLSDARGSACQPLAIRDDNNNPRAGATLTFDFSTCPSDLRICVAQPDQQGLPSQPAVVTCGGRIITVSADASGQLCIAFVGGTSLADGYGPRASDRPLCCNVYAEGLFMRTAIVSVASYDLNADGVIDAIDLSRWLALAGGQSGAYRSKADYNGDGAITAGDLSLWLEFAGRNPGPSAIGCAGYCP